MYPVHPEIVHRNDPKHEIFRFDIQSEMAIETEFKTLFTSPCMFVRDDGRLFCYFWLKIIPSFLSFSFSYLGFF